MAEGWSYIGELMRSKSGEHRLMERVQREIDRIIEERGEPRSEEEALAIFTEAWNRFGYRVVDCRKKSLLRRLKECLLRLI